MDFFLLISTEFRNSLVFYHQSFQDESKNITPVSLRDHTAFSVHVSSMVVDRFWYF